MILLKPSLISGLENLAAAVQSDRDALQSALCDSLQSAIKLEHATIPVYLYALYSLDADKAPEIADIIQSIATEEMLHMTLASNLLNALGGSPQIDHPGFIPIYPGPLPGGVESDLTVNLAPFSMAQLETFLDIEEPENPIDFKTLAGSAGQLTIGQFYTAIGKAIVVLGDKAFVNPPRNQVGPDLMPEAVVVHDVASALLAINTITEQGEGTSASPLDGIGDELAHYYRFMQIMKGHLLVPNPQAPDGYSYTGAALPFDPASVYNAPSNPALAPGYPTGSAQAFANDNFNYTYTSLLASLHNLFNGDVSQDQMNCAIGLMMSLKGQAKAMMAGIPNPAVITGPSFEYQPVNPRSV